MTVRKAVLLAAAVAFFAISALAADVTGKWTATVEGRGGSQEVTFDLKADGNNLTGSVTTPRGAGDIKNGKVDGDNISFDQVLSMGGNERTINYTGKVAGDEIHFTRKFGDRPGTEFTAKRAK